MSIAEFRVSDRGQMALPAEARRRWHLNDGGSVEVADLGDTADLPQGERGAPGIEVFQIHESRTTSICSGAGRAKERCSQCPS
jgi:bifunctional DNA-binding transcriptional regulator/antitoxin component of YhaV-PrlF toxin-antitoxin module